jgi:hypothetical protein
MLQLWFVANTVLWPLSIKVGERHVQPNEVLLVVAGTFWLFRSRRITTSSIKVLLAFLAYFLLSLAAAWAGPCVDLFDKSFSTALLLMLLILIGVEVGRRVSSGDWLRVQKAATWSLIAAFGGFCVEALAPAWFPNQTGYRATGRLSGLFSEPSAAAFSLVPCVVVLLVAERKSVRRRGMFALLGLLLVSRSSTLIALVAAWLLYRFLVKRKLKLALQIAVGVALFTALASTLNYELLLAPTVNRAIGVTAASDANNLSSLVYVQGWQDAWANLVRTRGLGLGFNMMGCHPLPDVPTRRALGLIVEGFDELNAQDGSILFGKVVSEAGVFGIAFFIAVICWWIRLERDMATHRDDPAYFAVAVQSALVFSFLASSFIRSSGYFCGSLLLLVTAVSAATKWQAQLKRQPHLLSALKPTHRAIL